MAKNYKTPVHKLLNWYKKSRDNWKSKCRDAKLELKRKNERIRRLEEIIARLKSQKDMPNNQHLEQNTKEKSNNTLPMRVFDRHPTFHSFSFVHIHMFISLVIAGCSSLRSASRNISIFFSSLNIPQPTPSWQTGRLWLLRIGLYKLIRPKQIADDWVLIIDHTLKIGCEKCLVILGFRRSQLPAGEAYVYHQDVEPIELIPVSKSNGDVVWQQLNRAAEKTGVPCQIVADCGPDIKAGIERFCNDHPETRFVPDIKHKVASLLKKELGKDADWQEYAASCANTARQLQQTDLAHLIPPQQRSKARYMNIEPLVQWGRKSLVLLENLTDIAAETDLDAKRVEQQLGWLNHFQQDLEEWNDLMTTVKSVEGYVKFVGIYDDCHLQLEHDPICSPRTEQSKAAYDWLASFIKEQALKAGEDEWLLGSSEIIESTFGKLKNLENDQTKGGFTAMILGLAACVGTTTQETIENALNAVPTKRLLEWIKENIPESVQSRRKKLSARLKTVCEAQI